MKMLENIKMDNQQLNPEQGRVQRLSHRGVLNDVNSYIVWETPSTDNKIYLYFLQSEKETRYVGITSSPNTRLSHHVSDRNNNASYKNNWINKCINKGHDITMIVKESFDTYDEALIKEEFYINSLENLTNLELSPTTPKVKNCYLYDLKTKHITEYNSLQSCAEALKTVAGGLYSNIIQGRYLLNYDDDFDKVIFEKHTIKAKLTPTSNTLYFVSYQHAAWSLNCSKNAINLQLNGARKTCKKYTFSKKDDEFVFKTSKLRKKVKCINDGLVFESIKDAAAYYKIDQSCIGKVCKGVRKKVKGKVFKYYQ